jgi:hypothetical protein
MVLAHWQTWGLSYGCIQAWFCDRPLTEETLVAVLAAFLLLEEV